MRKLIGDYATDDGTQGKDHPVFLVGRSAFLQLAGWLAVWLARWAFSFRPRGEASRPEPMPLENLSTLATTKKPQTLK